jgi:hypothetical protein
MGTAGSGGAGGSYRSGGGVLYYVSGGQLQADDVEPLG